MTGIGIGFLIVAATVLGAGGAAGQESEFVITQGGRRIASERVNRSGDRLTGDLRIGEQARITFTAHTDAGALVPELEFAFYGAGAADPAAHGTVSFRGDSAVARVRSPASPPEQRFATGAGALPYINLSAGLLEQLVRRARVVGGDEVRVPLLAIENGTAFSATVRRVAPDSAIVVLPPQVELRLRVDAEGRLMGGAVPSQGVTIARAGTEAAASALAPPDYSAPSGAPYTAEEVRIPTPAGYTLAGTLTLPRDRSGRVPGAVLISGSGLQDRDSAIPGVEGYRPFRQIADALARRGIAVLRVDDRGAGASGGDPTKATSADFADDVRAELAYLRTRAEIDGGELVLIGHSEGGIIAPMVAVGDPGVKAVVLMAGPAWTGRRTSDYQLREAWKGMGLTEEQMVEKKAANDPLREDMAAKNPWLRFWMDYDPLPTARRLRVPVLILQGATDRQVPAEQADELAAATRSGGDREVTVRVFPDVNHLFLHDPAGTAGIATYAALPSKSVPADVLTTLGDWLATRLK
jgi:alpha-beta hydrolase superfamily lysophospholipase